MTGRLTWRTSERRQHALRIGDLLYGVEFSDFDSPLWSRATAFSEKLNFVELGKRISNLDDVGIVYIWPSLEHYFVLVSYADRAGVWDWSQVWVISRSEANPFLYKITFPARSNWKREGF